MLNTTKDSIGKVQNMADQFGKNIFLMKTAVCCKPKSFQLLDTAIRMPGAGEVLIKLEGCGVCGSNLPVWDGRSWFEYPLEPGAPGHEGWGRIASVGDNVTTFKTGDRVTFLSGHSFAEFENVSIDKIVKLPEVLDSMPFPGEPLGCAMNVLKRSAIEAGQVVTVIGAGFIGALLVQLAVSKGAAVIAVSRRKYSLDMVSQYGIKESVLFSSSEEVREKVMRITNGNGCDCVIEATGYQQSLDIATDIVSLRGKIVIAGYHQDGIRMVDMQKWNWKGIDVINAHERDDQIYLQGIKDAIDAIVTKVVDPYPLFTHLIDIKNLNSAFQIMKSRPEGFMKALVIYDQ
jgi:threonine dehydrogenase-like Zn-dependent dehydrogenase